MQKDFVSISAVSTIKQVGEIAEIVQKEDLPFQVVIGYQLSNKSINQGTQNLRQPKFVELRDLDRETKSYGLTTALHYFTKDNQTVVSDLEKIVRLGINPNLTLLQLNTLPLETENLVRIKDMGFKIILPVAVSNKKDGGYAIWKGEGVQDVNSGEVEPLLEQVRERAKVIDYVLFDPSHGTNLELNLNEESLAVKFGRGIINEKRTKSLGLVYAGGIKPENVKELGKTLRGFFTKGVSIDVESGVRTDDFLDLKKVRDYLVGYQENDALPQPKGRGLK